MKKIARMACVLLVALAPFTVSAQDPPAAPPPCTAPTTAPAAEPATTATPTEPPAPPATEQAPQAAPANRPKVVVLPVDFTVYQVSAAGPETVPEWTVAARKNLEEGLALVMRNHAGLDYVAMPDLTATERQTLDEYLALAKVIDLQGRQLQFRDWAPRRAEFDRRLGPDLAFLRERTGADYAVLVHGMQSEQSGGLIATQILAAAAGVALIFPTGAHVSTTVIDLANGEVKWFNHADGGEVLGIGSVDTRKPESTAKLLEKLFEPYPSIPALEEKKK